MIKPVSTATLCLALAPAVALLAGCATNWQNPRIADPVQRDRQLVIDNGYCKQVAVGSAPMPNVAMPNNPTPQNYAFNARSTTTGAYGSSTTNYTGNVSAYPNAGQSFTNGVVQGAAVGVLIRAKRNQDEIHRGCMYQLGWME